MRHWSIRFSPFFVSWGRTLDDNYRSDSWDRLWLLQIQFSWVSIVGGGRIGPCETPFPCQWWRGIETWSLSARSWQPGQVISSSLDIGKTLKHYLLGRLLLGPWPRTSADVALFEWRLTKHWLPSVLACTTLHFTYRFQRGNYFTSILNLQHPKASVAQISSIQALSHLPPLCCWSQLSVPTQLIFVTRWAS